MADGIPGDRQEADPLTILVPTCNRPQFLARLLNYYSACGAPFPLHVLDSSQEPFADREPQALSRSPNIVYARYDPHLMPMPKLSEGLQRVTTPYVVFWGDDDLMVPRSLGRAVRFLEDHQDFSLAHGTGGLFEVAVVKRHHVLMQMGPLPQRSYTEETASARLLRFMAQGCSLFHSVQRTASLRRNVAQCVAHGFGYYWAERALAFLALVQGKAKALDGLYIARQVHGGQASRDLQERFDCFDWMSSEDFPKRYQAFRTSVSQALAAQDGISMSEARELVKRAVWSQCAKGLSSAWQDRYSVKPSGVRLRAAVRRLPGVRQVSQWLRWMGVPPDGNPISVPGLLRPASPHRGDFLQVYRAVRTAAWAP